MTRKKKHRITIAGDTSQPTLTRAHATLSHIGDQNECGARTKLHKLPGFSFGLVPVARGPPVTVNGMRGKVSAVAVHMPTDTDDVLESLPTPGRVRPAEVKAHVTSTDGISPVFRGDMPQLAHSIARRVDSSAVAKVGRHGLTEFPPQLWVLHPL